MNTFDVIVLGAGGAGLMCAATAGQRGCNVLVIDHAKAPGNKILISGGGRCNFTNLDVRPNCFLSQNPHFAKSALSRYSSRDFMDLVDRHGIAWHEKTLGQLFCDGSAKQIVDMLMAECAKGKVSFVFASPIRDVAHEDDLFTVRHESGTATAPSLVIATGGPSIPKIGATGFAYDLARQFGLKIVEPRPALVPLKLGPDDALFRDLSGVAADVVTRKEKTTFREAALFTHKGLSGPAVLQISSYWRHGETISVDFMPDMHDGWLREAKRAEPKAKARAVIARYLPERLASALAERMRVADGGLADQSDKALAAIEEQLANWHFTPTGTEGFAKAEVTIGGISTDELSSKTMEAKKRPGLFAIGEAVDVTGWLGGYNFQWAWASGFAAGQAV